MPELRDDIHNAYIRLRGEGNVYHADVENAQYVIEEMITHGELVRR